MKLPCIKQSRKILGICGFLLAGVAVFALSFTKIPLPKLPPEDSLFFLNETASLRQGLYLKIPSWFYHNGDYVVYMPTAEASELIESRHWMPEHTDFLLKKIGAMEGEEYDVDPRTMNFSIRGKYVGQAFAEDRQGNPMPVKYGRHVVSMGEFLPVGTAPRSFDGRYTGTIPMDHICAKVIPLVTW